VPFTNIACKINDGDHPIYTLLNALISLKMWGEKALEAEMVNKSFELV
jgi:hypothetical protein